MLWALSATWLRSRAFSAAELQLLRFTYCIFLLFAFSLELAKRVLVTRIEAATQHVAHMTSGWGEGPGGSPGRAHCTWPLFVCFYNSDWGEIAYFCALLSFHFISHSSSVSASISGRSLARIFSNVLLNVVYRLHGTLRLLDDCTYFSHASLAVLALCLLCE